MPWLLGLSLSVVALAGLVRSEPHRYESVEPHMGTLVRITLYAPDEQAARDAFRAAFERIRHLDGVLSDYRPDSELNQITTATAGRAVRALVRDTGRADRADRSPAPTLPAGVVAVTGDLHRPETLSAAGDGVRGAFLLSGYNDLPRTLAMMRRAGVEHVVLLSSQSAADSDVTNAVARYHILSEESVRESGLSWTFLRPSSFMSNALQWIPQLRAGDLVRESFADVRVAAVDPHDIAAVVIEALHSPSHVGRSSPRAPFI